MIEGRGPAPLFVLSLIRRLPDTSLTVALALGGDDYFGWGRDRYMLADLYDAINTNTRATGNWGKKPPKIPEYPRPESTEGSQAEKVTTVADLYKKLQLSAGQH